MLYKVLILVLSICFAGVSLGQTLEWESITAVGNVRDIAISSDAVWGGSNGGVLQLQLGSEEIVKFTNTDGLFSNEVVAAVFDQHGTIWFALEGGLLNRYFPEPDRWELFRDYEDQVITDLVAFGDSLYVGLDLGVSLFTIDKLEVKETYVNLGLSTGENIEKIGANAVFIDGFDIWVATDKGIAQSSLTFSNLQAPANWNQHTEAQGLPSNIVNDIIVVEGVPHAATNRGVARFGDGRWQRIGQLIDQIARIRFVAPNQLFPQTTIISLFEGKIFWYDVAADTWRSLTPDFQDVTSVQSDEAEIWIGRRDVGLARFDGGSQEWQLFTDNSPSSSHFASLALDSQGRLWAANPRDFSVSTPNGGVNMFDGQSWRSFTAADGLKRLDQRTILVDDRDRIWAGSWGGGITIFEDTGSGFTSTQIDTNGGLLAGFVGNPNFILVNALTKDDAGNIWILNREAVTNNILVTHTTDNEWFRYSTSEGLVSRFVLSVIVDNSDRVWVGTEDRGISVLDYNNTFGNKSDDDFTQGLNASEGLFSNRINAMAEDLDGTIWIGTDEGLNFWFRGDVGNRFGLINDFVNTIGVDARNNKWFGTANGVSILSNDGVTWTHFTTANSPLVNANVLSFAFDDETGDVWIGTRNGLSRLRTPFVAPKENLNSLAGFPNPFILEAGKVFTITNLAENTSINIYDVSGRLVRTFDAFTDIDGGFVLWDGRNEKGSLVASGVYVYLAFTDGGISATGKVAVIRP